MNTSEGGRAPRIVAVDAARGLAIIGVLLAHAPVSIADADILHALQFSFGWCVTAFFGFSGWIEGSFARADKFREYIKKRTARLLIPFFLLYFGYGLALHVLAIYGFVRAPAIKSSGLFQNVVSGYAPQLYFLPYLWVVGCGLFYLLRRYPETVCLALVFGQIIMRLLISSDGYGYGPDWRNIPGYAASFAICYTSHKGLSRSTQAICLFGGAAEILLHGSYTAVHPLFALYLIKGINFGSKWLGLCLSPLGRWSFPIYLWHVPLVMPGVNMTLSGFQPSILKLCSVLVITAGICAGIGAALSRLPLLYRLGK